MVGIYKITNKLNGKSYIGQSNNIERRWGEHKRTSSSQNKNQLYKDFEIYGIDNFKFEILEQCELEQLNEREIYWIKYYNSYNNGYNLTTGGQFNKNIELWNQIKYQLNPYKLEDSTWLVYFYLYSQGHILNTYIYLPKIKSKKSIYQKIGISKASFYRALEKLISLDILTSDLSQMRQLTFSFSSDEVKEILELDFYQKIIPIRVYCLWKLIQNFNISELTKRCICDCLNYSTTHTNNYKKIEKDLNNLLKKYPIIIN